MSGTQSVLLVICVGLLLATSYLAAVDTVVSRLDLVRALRLDEEDRRGSSSLVWLIQHRSAALSVLLVLTVSARIALASLATVLASAWWSTAPGVVGAVVLVTVLSLIVGEVTPRTVVLRHLEGSGLRLAGSARLLVRGLEPLARVLVALGRALVPRQHEVSGPYATDDELQPDEDEEEDEELEPGEREMISSIIELADTLVREIMVPRPDMVTVSERATLAEVVGVAIERGASRLPVHEQDDPDTIVGVVYAKDLLRRLAIEPSRQRWFDLVRPPTFVPEVKRCDELLRDLQAATVHLAMVVDEYGELVGLVTIEDILEEIVGEIVDEHDHEEPLVELLDDGRYRVDARLGVDDLNDLLGTDLPDDGFDSVGGLVFTTLGRVPAEGEALELEGTSIAIESVQGRRIGKVLVARDARPDGGADGPLDRGPAAATGATRHA